jgi:hypothetical protein
MSIMLHIYEHAMSTVLDSPNKDEIVEALPFYIAKIAIVMKQLYTQDISNDL